MSVRFVRNRLAPLVFALASRACFRLSIDDRDAGVVCLGNPNAEKPLITITIDPEEMSRRGRIGAHVLHSRYDGRELTKNAREAFRKQFLDQVDPNLPEDERQRRAEHLRKAHYARLSRLSQQARAAKKKAAGSEPAAVVKG